MANDKPGTTATETQPNTPSKDDAERAKLLKQLEEAQRVIAKLERDNEEKAAALREELERTTGAAMSGQRIKETPLKLDGSPAFKFRVGPKALMYPNQRPEKGTVCPDHLKIETIQTVDEVEAIRWYAANHELRANSGKHIDLVRCPIVAVCVDPTREQIRQDKEGLGVVRKKLAANQPLTEIDRELINKYPNEAYK